MALIFTVLFVLGIQPPDSVIHTRLSSFLLIIFLDCLQITVYYRAPYAILLVLIDSVSYVHTVCVNPNLINYSSYCLTFFKSKFIFYFWESASVL